MRRATMNHSLYFFPAALAAVLLLTACPEPAPSDPKDPDEREEGQSDFLSAGSADDYSNGRYDTDAPVAGDGTEEGADGDGNGERTVEEGDIYRILGDGLILNLNSFRGLQLIDFSDLSDPTIIGRAHVTGHPVELYVHGDHAIVLMNDWRGYYGSRFAADIASVTGGLVLSVDISDPTSPQVVEQVHVPGRISTSRLVHGGGQAALYVAAGEQSYHHDPDTGGHFHTETYVRSFEVTGGNITPRSEIDLGGFVSDIQATPTALLVARNERWWSSGEEPSRVSVIDISSPDGTMTEGDEVEVAGFVFTQFNMDLYNDVLRVVSGSRWGSRPANYIETFDASDLSNLEPIDQEEFGAGEDLYATLFLGNKAFFVTYFQVDPFHAFEITDEGIATEMSEFVVSGWNDYFRAVFDETRLIGIGKNDEQGNQQAVSLYDITDLANPEPLLARAEVDMHWSWSEAQWDHRAFSVLQNAVDVLTEDGVQETGLVLLPFSGWDYDEETGWGTYRSAVQIFTFSESTLTRRGVMEHPTQVRRSFLANSEAVANLSETDLAFFDHQDPDDPQPLGSVELAPDYSDFFVFGDYAVRRKDVGHSWWYYRNDPSATTQLEVIPADGDPDLSEALASFEVDRQARLLQVDDLLAVLWNRPEESETDGSSDGGGPNDDGFIPSLTVYDLSDPLQPESLATIDVTAAFSGTAHRSHWDVHVVGEGLVLVTSEHHREVVETEEVCYLEPMHPCEIDEPCVEYFSEELQCERDDSGDLTCTGTIIRCEYEPDTRDVTCEELDASDLPDLEDYVYCWDRDRYNWWVERNIRPIDLSDPSQPEVRQVITSDQNDQPAGAIASGSDLYLSFARPESVENNDRDYVRWFFQRIDFSNYAEPQIHDPVNVPGWLIAVDGDFVYTRDSLYNEDNRIETAVARCEVIDGSAYLRGVRVFENRWVNAVQLDGAGNLLVTHGTAWWWDGPVTGGTTDGTRDDDDGDENLHTLSVLDATSSEFTVLAEAGVDTWASLQDARPGRALFRVPGGLLVMNLDDSAQPYPQAYFATSGWPRSIRVLGGDIVVAAGRHGIYRFPLDEFNLLPAL